MLKFEEAKGILQQNSREAYESRMLFKLKEGEGEEGDSCIPEKVSPYFGECVQKPFISLKFEGVRLSSLEIENNSTGCGDRKFDDLIPFACFE
ncbi:hypothetical protein TNCV_1718791 [Trichonephila clavipes]|nr:hypothetical protein TNCV_1718791 [Trichonephila clavipes]